MAARSIFIFFLLLLAMAPYADEAKPAFDFQLKQFLTTEPDKPIMVYADRIHARSSLQRFYDERGLKPAWSGKMQQTLLQQLMSAIDQSVLQGLNPVDYHQSSLESAINKNDLQAIELLATDAYLTLAAHIVGGRLNPVTVEPDWTANKRERDLVLHLEKALSSQTIAKSLQELEPNAVGYQVLKKALALFNQPGTENHGWVAIDQGKAMKLGDTGPRVAALRKRLEVTGLLDSTSVSPDTFDSALESAVASFQRRVGLEPDGIVGAVTLEQLNKTRSERVDQIRANMERWRWLDEDLGNRHIRVNIADYNLAAYENSAIVRQHDVIVGKNYRKTPVFSGEISYLVLNPWWETPASLARQDKLPAFKKEPALVSKLGFQILDREGKVVDSSTLKWSDFSASNFPFRLRQSPGPQNALGKVKLMFPNRHNVYLHDTPSQQLFSKVERNFSSGCVRVADVLLLTEWVLGKTDGWSMDKINNVVADGRETRINLAARIPVHILYFTAVANQDGTLRFINDIYQRDARLIAALSKNQFTVSQ